MSTVALGAGVGGAVQAFAKASPALAGEARQALIATGNSLRTTAGGIGMSTSMPWLNATSGPNMLASSLDEVMRARTGIKEAYDLVKVAGAPRQFLQLEQELAGQWRALEAIVGPRAESLQVIKTAGGDLGLKGLKVGSGEAGLAAVAGQREAAVVAAADNALTLEAPTARAGAKAIQDAVMGASRWSHLLADELGAALRG
jgi:hypothetical protein